MRSSLVCAVLGLALLAGCSKRPTAPPVAGPTRYLVFASDRGHVPGSFRNWIEALDGGGGIAQFNARGTSDTLIERHPSLTQDGRLVAWQGSGGRGNSQDVFLYDRSSNALTDDPNINTSADETDPCLSLDGTRLAFVRDSLGTRHLRLYDLTTHRLIPLYNLEATGYSDWEPSLDAQGHRIAFTTNRNGSDDVVVYQVSTRAFVATPAMQDPAAADHEPGISGDGRYVAFASNRAGGTGGYDLYLYDVSNGLLVALPGNANSAFDDRDPTVSVDGSNILFVSNRAGGAGGLDLWHLNRIAAVLTQPNGESSSSDDVDPAVVWP